MHYWPRVQTQKDSSSHHCFYQSSVYTTCKCTRLEIVVRYRGSGSEINNEKRILEPGKTLVHSGSPCRLYSAVSLEDNRQRNRGTYQRYARASGLLWAVSDYQVEVPRSHKGRGVSESTFARDSTESRNICHQGRPVPGYGRSDLDGCGLNCSRSQYHLSQRCNFNEEAVRKGTQGNRVLHKKEECIFTRWCNPRNREDSKEIKGIFFPQKKMQK